MKKLSYKQLTKRFPSLLRFVGYALLFFSFCCFGYILVSEKVPAPTREWDTPDAAGLELIDPTPWTVTPQEVCRFILFGVTFALIGTTTIFLSYRKKI